jgi:hypothetical protein
VDGDKIVIHLGKNYNFLPSYQWLSIKTASRREGIIINNKFISIKMTIALFIAVIMIVLYLVFLVGMKMVEGFNNIEQRIPQSQQQWNK